jgi:hypothetical protein
LCFLKKEGGGERDTERENRLTFYVFLKKEEGGRERRTHRERTDLPSVFFKEGRRRGREREEGGGGGGEALASLFSRVLKQTTLMIYNILKKTFVL